MAIRFFKLYTIKDIDYNAVVSKYRQLCENGEVEIDSDTLCVYSSSQSEVKYIVKRNARKPLKDDTKIKNKALFLVHIIAYRQQTSRDNNANGAPIQYSILQKVLGIDVYELLKALTECGYIQKSNIYSIGKSIRYKILGDVITVQSSNITILKYIDKSRDILAEEITRRLTSPEFVNEYGDKFAGTYVKNLNKFKIANEKGFNAYAKARIKENADKEGYYDYIRNGFKNKLKVYSIDSNNRIYHILTSLERELKQYLNIKFSVDCANSHPLLFNYFIFNSKSISIADAYKISYILANTPLSYFLSVVPNSHYDIEKLRNTLIDNHINKSKITVIEDDTLIYMWKTINGCFWDDILAEHQGSGLDRNEIKQKMFAEVFYSKTPKIAWKQFAKEFKKQYPNVYALILRWKRPLRYQDTRQILLRHHKAVEFEGKAIMNNEPTALPNIMMCLESDIFKNILQTLFRKRICAVHIHDAIVVPMVKSTETITSNKVQDVMRKVYKLYGLYPTFKVDTYQ